jgi:hypothetical protein
MVAANTSCQPAFFIGLLQDQSVFNLRAHTIIGMGDILAMEKMLNIKGHNAFCPCRSCKIKGARNISAGQSIYYHLFANKGCH